MSNAAPQVILASTSPRRRELLDQIGVRYDTLAVSVDEIPRPGEAPEAYVRRAAGDKSRQGFERSGGRLPVLAADTEVILDGEVLGKPLDGDHALAMLGRLSGREHLVLSAVSLRAGEQHWEALNVNSVVFRELSREEMLAYWDSGEPRGKAGAYGIQGRGALFIRHLAGSFSGVMGLPLFETGSLLREIGIPVVRLLRDDPVEP